jgi:hypothetical protein
VTAGPAVLLAPGLAPPAAPLSALGPGDLAEVVLFVILFLVWVVTRFTKKPDPRKPADRPGPAEPPAPPAEPAPRRVPPPPPRGARASRPKAVPPVVVARAEAAGDARVRREDAPAADFDAARDLSKRTAAVAGASARLRRPSGAALLRLGDVPPGDRVRAAVLWSEVLGPPTSRRRGRRR